MGSLYPLPNVLVHTSLLMAINRFDLVLEFSLTVLAIPFCIVIFTGKYKYWKDLRHLALHSH